MVITERTVLSQVTVLHEHGVIHVLWNNIVERDGVEIARTNTRRAYMESEKEKFLTDVPHGEAYTIAVGWA